MPIEIRELHIKVSVTTPAEAQTSTGVSASGSRDAQANDKAEIVAACVEQVMEILQNKTER
jgi:hypothetical protein